MKDPLARLHGTLMRALDNGATPEDLREALAYCISRHKRMEKSKAQDAPAKDASDV